MPWTLRLLVDAADILLTCRCRTCRSLLTPGTSHLLDIAVDTPLLIANAEVPHLLADPADLLPLADATDLVDCSSALDLAIACPLDLAIAR